MYNIFIKIKILIIIFYIFYFKPMNPSDPKDLILYDNLIVKAFSSSFNIFLWMAPHKHIH